MSLRARRAVLLSIVGLLAWPGTLLLASPSARARLEIGLCRSATIDALGGRWGEEERLRAVERLETARIPGEAGEDDELDLVRCMGEIESEIHSKPTTLPVRQVTSGIAIVRSSSGRRR